MIYFLRLFEVKMERKTNEMKIKNKKPHHYPQQFLSFCTGTCTYILRESPIKLKGSKIGETSRLTGHIVVTIYFCKLCDV